MVFVNHLPQPKDQFREHLQLQRLDLAHIYLRHHVKSVDDKNNSILSLLVSLLSRVLTLRVLPSLNPKTSSIIPASSHPHPCLLHDKHSRLGSKSHCALDFESSKSVLLLFVLALIIQTLEPRVEAFEFNSSITASPNVDGLPSTTISDAFNWSSGYFDPTFAPGVSVNTASPG